MLQQTTTKIPLKDVPNGVFFRVIGSTKSANCAEYQGKFLLCMANPRLPHKMRRKDDELVALFLFLEQEKNQAAMVIVREIDFDIADDVLVEQASPSTPEVHARTRYPVVRLTDNPPHPEDFRSMRLGKLHPNGTLLHGADSNGKRGGRGGKKRGGGRRNRNGRTQAS